MCCAVFGHCRKVACLNAAVRIVRDMDDIATFVVNALQPATVSRVVLDEEEGRIEVVVPDDQLSFDGSRLNNFPKPPGPRAADPAKDMLDGIKSMMEASTANFLLLAGHHPVYSACEHGNNQILIEQIQPLLEKHNAHYFSGHDHCQVVIFLLISRFSYSFLVFSYSFHQMHIQPPGSAVNYILTGMGDFCCYQASNIDSLPDGEKSLKYILASKHNPTKAHGGFASLRFRGDELTVDIHDQDGVTLYSTPTIPSRSAK